MKPSGLTAWCIHTSGSALVYGLNPRSEKDLAKNARKEAPLVRRPYKGLCIKYTFPSSFPNSGPAV